MLHSRAARPAVGSERGRVGSGRYIIEALEQRVLLLFTPDLDVISVTGTASFYNVGNFIQATAHIANIGEFLSNTGAFDLEFWLSRNGDTSKYRFIESGSVLNVLQGVPTSDVINFPGYKVPENVPAGTYHITVYLDTGNDVAELNEGNNFGVSSNFLIVKPDLLVSSVALEQQTYGRGQSLDAVATIRNSGTGSTFPVAPFGFNLEFYLGTADGSNKTLRYIEEGVVSFLGSGESTTDVINGLGWIIPDDLPFGQYRVWVRADSGGHVPESDENNNWGSSAVIQIGEPDLVVPVVDAEDDVLAYGEFLNATATIRNAGPGSTLQEAPLGFNLAFYLGPADGSDKTLHHIQNGLVTYLEGGQQTTDVINGLGWLISPTTVQPGEYRVWVRADSTDTVPESDEANNWGSSDVVTIQGARWETEGGALLVNSRTEATPIYLAAYAAGVSTSSKILADIYEDDLDFNDLLEPDVALDYVGGDGGFKWRRRWVPYRTSDLVGGIGGDPEYFFRVTNAPAIGPFNGSSNVTIVPHPGEFGVELVHHTVGTGVPLVLVHGNNSDEAFDLYRWKGFLNWIEDNPSHFAEFDVYLWKHDTSQPVGFNGAAGTQADRLATYIYDTLGLGMPGTAYEHTKVVLVGHSQGGMVSRSFMNTFNPARGHKQGEDVSTLITIGTPHHGSPFGIQDWVAALTATAFGPTTGPDLADGPIFAALLEHALDADVGDLNLAWDNLDGVVAGSYATHFPLGSSYYLTPRDTNSVNAFPDETVVYTDGIKSQYGTLAALNAGEGFVHKLVTVGGYDTSLADNVSAAEYANKLLAGGISEHDQLSAVTALLALMSGANLGNSNPSNYIANDGLVPLQSALFLDLPATGLSISSLLGGNVHLLDSAVAAHVPRDMFHFIFSSDDGIDDHADVLETTNPDYWTTITNRLRAVLETVPPTATPADPGDGGSIPVTLVNGRGYLDVTFADAGGSTLDPTTILDAAPEFTLSGAAAAGVTLGGAPLRIGDYTYRYPFSGAFAPGAVTISFIAGSFADDAGNLSQADGRSFDVAPTPPQVTSAAFEYASRHAVTITFSADVGASLSAGDLVLANLTTAQDVPTSIVAVAYDPATNTATFTFPGYASGILPDGNYRATLSAAGVTDAAGTPLAADHVIDFFVLAGDGNRDRSVNILDFQVWQNHFNQNPATFADGDYNYDRAVNILDFQVWRDNFNQTLDVPQPAIAITVLGGDSPIMSGSLADGQSPRRNLLDADEEDELRARRASRKPVFDRETVPRRRAVRFS